MDPLFYLCFVFVMLSCLFIATLWSLAGKDWPLGSLVCDVFVCFVIFHMVSWVRCGT